MNSAQHDYRTVLAVFAMGAGMLGLVGCGETAQIDVRTVPKQVIEEQEFPGLHEKADTILAALVPRGSEAWVFRLDGADDEVASQAEAFESFIGSISFSEAGSRPMWQLPPGWEESPAPAGSLREASIRVPLEAGGALDLSVSRLPLREDWLHYRLRNVNRWRMQLQLPVASAGEMEAATKTVELDGSAGPAAIVTITGKFSDSELAKMTGRGALAARTAPQTPATRSAERPAELTYDVPEGWGPGPASSMRLASFEVSDGSRKASIAVTAFPATAAKIADPLDNVNRWRSEVKLPPVGDDEIATLTEPIEVDGHEGLYVALDGEASGLATRVAMVEYQGRVWFFKLHGPQDLVARETERLREFIRSVEFTGR